MAERLSVGQQVEAEALRQRFQKAVSLAEWDTAPVFERIARRAAQSMLGPAFIVDDTGFPKQGDSSVGVQRQYSGTLGKIGNCQVATSVHLATDSLSSCIGMRLFLPKGWAQDTARREKAKVPEDIEFAPKWQLALEMIDSATNWVGPHVVLADAGYGDSGEFRAGLEERGLQYAVGVNGQHLVWPPEAHPEVPKAGGTGRPPCRYRDDEHPPVRLCELAKRVKFRRVTWREGAKGDPSARDSATSCERNSGGYGGRVLGMWISYPVERGSVHETGATPGTAGPELLREGRGDRRYDGGWPEEPPGPHEDRCGGC